jgi:hypothetical protein
MRGSRKADTGLTPMQIARRMPIVRRAMSPREVDEAATRLQRFRRQALEQFGVAASSFLLALGATQVYAELAIPFLFGGVVVGALGLRTEWLHWDLLDRLAGQPDAQAIPEVHAYASRARPEDHQPVVRRPPRVR